jgi:hypothetical protein
VLREQDFRILARHDTLAKLMRTNGANLFSRRKLLLCLAACRFANAQELKGRWGATAGQREFGGTWTARPGDEPETATGTWTLLDPNWRPLASGTWSARKRKAGWEGRWQAEVAGGVKHSGSWTAQIGGSGSVPMMDLFRLAFDHTVAGVWRSDSRASGNWSIKAD